ncbi:hypothetical protein KY289_015358 [Solanum tuberosum]|nr:hypothetical protein KY289_015358 [Solanum tuberosum]KAH0700792.1 hypothetical protein KY284_015007 [Solanum tuberosum]
MSLSVPPELRDPSIWRRGRLSSKRGVLKLTNIQSLATMSPSPAVVTRNFAILFPSIAYVSFFGGFGNNYVGVQFGGQKYIIGDVAQMVERSLCMREVISLKRFNHLKILRNFNPNTYKQHLTLKRLVDISMESLLLSQSHGFDYSAGVIWWCPVFFPKVFSFCRFFELIIIKCLVIRLDLETFFQVHSSVCAWRNHKTSWKSYLSCWVYNVRWYFDVAAGFEHQRRDVNRLISPSVISHPIDSIHCFPLASGILFFKIIP